VKQPQVKTLNALRSRAPVLRSVFYVFALSLLVLQASSLVHSIEHHSFDQQSFCELHFSSDNHSVIDRSDFKLLTAVTCSVFVSAFVANIQIQRVSYYASRAPPLV